MFSFLFLFACRNISPKQPESVHSFEKYIDIDQPILAATELAEQSLVYSTGEQLWLLENDFETPMEVDVSSLPPGQIVFVDTMDSKLLAYVYGKGLYLKEWEVDSTWESADNGLTSPLLNALNPYSTPFPMAIKEDSSGTAWMASAGGLFSTTESQLDWTMQETSSSGSVNPLFSDIAIEENTIAAVSLLPASILPSQYSSLLTGTIFLKEDTSEWQEIGDTLPSIYPSSVALNSHKEIYVGTLDQGIWEYSAGSWNKIDGSPSDVIALQWSHGGLSVGSASKGMWRYEQNTWSQVGSSPISGLTENFATSTRGSIWRLQEGEGTPPPEQTKGRIFIALSFHANYYHSYRGDSVDDDGFGIDIEVIRNTLDWLDENPDVQGNWDFDNAFTTDLWMLDHSPDIIERISQRVSEGKDEVRIMSWNNGAMAASTKEEFATSIEWAFSSNENAFGDVVPGVQPQECMFSPDHLSWYQENGVTWITMFYVANGFTALRQDINLSGIELHNPVSLVDPITNGSMTLVPVYHHADLLDHGGLAGWAKQLSSTYAEDQLLVIHFDADAESWESFDLELQQVSELDFVEWSTISSYLDNHEPVSTIEILGDVADGTGDGFQSWAEKDTNHQLYTKVVQARTSTERAQFIAGEQGEVEILLQDALTPRLLALSTTNYGLAAPYLHEDRVISSHQQADEAIALANEALEKSLTYLEIEANTIQIINPRKSAGLALLEFEIILPSASWIGNQHLSITDENAQLLRFTASFQHNDEQGDHIKIQMILPVQAEAIQELQWSYDLSVNHEEDSPQNQQNISLETLQPPLIECNSIEERGFLLESTVSEVSTATIYNETWSFTACGHQGSLQRQIEIWDNFPGAIIRVSTVFPEVSEPNDLETIALTPLQCTNGISEILWQSYGGQIRNRPARFPVESWNGQAADGWVGLQCGNDTQLFVSHRTLQRTSMAFAPIRNEGTTSFMAPLGTIWGDSPWHFGRNTGGHGIGEITTTTVGSQFRPAAPDWSGKTIEYTLLYTNELEEEQLDLFAHPPYIRSNNETN
jgi:hypothetical protein